MITQNNLQNVVLVGHSLAGVWMQMLLQQIPNRIASLVFIDAAVLLPGESFFSNRIGGVVSTLPAFPAQVPPLLPGNCLTRLTHSGKRRSEGAGNVSCKGVLECKPDRSISLILPA